MLNNMVAVSLSFRYISTQSKTSDPVKLHHLSSVSCVPSMRGFGDSVYLSHGFPFLLCKITRITPEKKCLRALIKTLPWTFNESAKLPSFTEFP